MSLHGKEKIWYVFDRLIDAREELLKQNMTSLGLNGVHNRSYLSVS